MPKIPTAPRKAKLARIAALAVAQTQVGVEENGRNNWGPKVQVYLKTTGISFPAAWCMAFVHWCYEQVGVHLGGTASVGNFVAWARKNGELIPIRPFRGDLVAFYFDGDSWPDHVGFVHRVLSIRLSGLWYIRTIEGNTGTSGAVSDPGTGRDGVRKKRRLVRRSKVVFVRIDDRVVG